MDEQLIELKSNNHQEFILTTNFYILQYILEFMEEQGLVSMYQTCKIWNLYMRSEELREKWLDRFKIQHSQFYQRLTSYTPDELFIRYMTIFIKMQEKDGEKSLLGYEHLYQQEFVEVKTKYFETLLVMIKSQVQQEINEYKLNFNWLDAFLEIGKFRNSAFARKLIETEPLVSTEENIIGFLKWASNEHQWSKYCHVYDNEAFHITQQARTSILDDWIDAKFPPYPTVKEPSSKNSNMMNVWQYDDRDCEAEQIPIIKNASFIIRKLIWVHFNCHFHDTHTPGPAKPFQYINDWGIDERKFYFQDKYPQYAQTDFINLDNIKATYKNENKQQNLEFIKSCLNFIELIYQQRPEYESKLIESFQNISQ